MSSYGNDELDDFNLRWGPEKSSNRKFIKDSKVHKQEITFHTQPEKASIGIPKAKLLSEFELEECKEAFGMFDSGNIGTILATDLDKTLRILDLDPTQAEVRNLIAEKSGEEGTGTVSFSEFISLLSQIRNENDDDEDLREAFVMLDPEHTGSIDKQKMKNIMTQLGHELTEADIDGMIREADLTGDGRVSFKEFCRIMNASH